MPRLRNRVRRRVAEPLEEPVADEEQEPEDTADEDGEEPEGEPTDPTARALDEESYSGRIGGGGTVADIAPGQLSRLSQQVTTGSGASVSIADQFDPGFTRTEIVNRLGMVLSLSFSYDYGRGEWVPDPIDKTERQAVEQELAEDRATNDLSGSVDTGEDTQVNSDGDLELRPKEDGSTTISGASKVGEDEFSSATIYLTPDDDYDEITVSWDVSPNNGLTVYVRRESDSTRINEVPWQDGEQAIPGPFEQGVDYAIGPQNNTDQFVAGVRDVGSPPIDTAVGEIYDYNPDGGTNSSGLVAFTDVGIQQPAESGEATSSFDNPCTASSTRSAQYDVCSKSSDVRVDLYEGDPFAADSKRLRADIQQREDITDLANSRTDLQYHIIIERSEDGESPKVSRLGHQLIR